MSGPAEDAANAMRRARRNWLATLLGTPWAFGGALALPPAAASAAPAGAAPTLTLVDLPLLEGGTFHAAQADGRVTVVYWWASWCPFCAEMSPSVEALWREHRDRGLIVLGISMDKTVEPAREHRRRKGYTFPSTWQGSVPGGALPPVAKVPTVWVRDRGGRVVMAETGQLFPEDIEQIARFL